MLPRPPPQFAHVAEDWLHIVGSDLQQAAQIPVSAKSGITVNAICPGYIATDMVKISAGILMLFIASLAWLRSGVWPYYDLRMLWEELHLRPWNVQEIIDSALALVPTLPLWAAAAFGWWKHVHRG